MLKLSKKVESILESVKSKIEYYRKELQDYNNTLESKQILSKYPEEYPYWLNKNNGVEICDFVSNDEFIYISPFVKSPIGQIRQIDKGLFKLLSYTKCNTNPELAETTNWEFIGFVDKKPIVDCSFSEFLELYVNDDFEKSFK